MAQKGDVRGAGREKHRRSNVQMYCKRKKVFKNFGINTKSWKGVLPLKNSPQRAHWHCIALVCLKFSGYVTDFTSEAMIYREGTWQLRLTHHAYPPTHRTVLSPLFNILNRQYLNQQAVTAILSCPEISFQLCSSSIPLFYFLYYCSDASVPSCSLKVNSVPESK